MKKKDITFLENNKIEFVLSTKKLGKERKFIVRKRTLILKIDSNSRYVKALKRYLARIKDEESKIYFFSRRTGYNIINRLGYDALGVSICPYNFRHSRMTLLAEKGATLEELMRVKGGRTIQSVRPYVHARKVEYEVEVEI